MCDILICLEMKCLRLMGSLLTFITKVWLATWHLPSNRQYRGPLREKNKQGCADQLQWWSPGASIGSARGKLEKVLEDNNGQGWNLAEVIPDNPNLLILVFRLIVLTLTLGLWTLSTSYLLILERPAEGQNSFPDKNSDVKNARREPGLFATRWDIRVRRLDSRLKKIHVARSEPSPSKQARLPAWGHTTCVATI